MGSLVLRLPFLLLLLLRAPAFAAFAAAEASLVLPRLAEIHYNISKKRCELNVAWAPVQPVDDSCNLLYESGFESGSDANQKLIERIWCEKPFRRVLVPLGIKIVFRARATCLNRSEGEWVNITLPQHGIAGTGATNIRCLWHNVEYVQCSWQRGKNAGRDTLYNLSYWYHDGPDEEQKCTNYTIQGDAFRCTFPFKTGLIKPFAISIHGSSEDVETVCMVTRATLEEAIPIKLHRVSKVNIKKSGDGVSLNWTPPLPWSGLCYEIEVNNSETKKMPLEEKTNVEIPLKSNEYHTFRVRTVLGEVGRHCEGKRGHWSDWSDQVEWDDRDNTFTILLILIPSCIAVMTIILLVHLKRIKLLILPTIPDPGKFLKGMFEDQSEDLQVKGMFMEPNKDFCKQTIELPVKEEPIHLLILTNQNEN